MPLAEFCDKAYEGLTSRKDQVIIGSIRPPEKFMDIVDKRRSTFEFLANIMRCH